LQEAKVVKHGFGSGRINLEHNACHILPVKIGCAVKIALRIPKKAGEDIASVCATLGGAKVVQHGFTGGLAKLENSANSDMSPLGCGAIEIASTVPNQASLGKSTIVGRPAEL
jgi:hypothetical protein